MPEASEAVAESVAVVEAVAPAPEPEPAPAGGPVAQIVPMSPEHIELMLRAAFVAGQVDMHRKTIDQAPLYYHERHYAQIAMADALGLAS